jgi:hypothetical protein
MLHLILSFVFLASGFSKSEYFKVIGGKDSKSLDKMIATLDKATASTDKNAYLGAITMKRAGFEETAKQKLDLFKKGKDLLEKSITANKKNTEYRFLRLIVQENAPKLLKYSANISEDAKWVKDNYKKCDSEIKQAVENYAAHSVVLDL